MGRLMKNLDIALPSSPAGRRTVWIDLHARTDLLHAFDDDALAGFQAFVDDPQRADAVAQLHGPDGDFVVAIDDGDLIRALQFGDGALRNQQCALAGFAIDVRTLRVLPGPQNVSGIGKQPGQPDRARCSDSPGGPRNRNLPFCG